MAFELWGATGVIDVSLPDRQFGNLLLLFYSLVLAYTVYRYRLDFFRLTPRQWMVTIGLSLLSLLVSQLFPLHISRNPVIILTLLAGVPFLLAGAILNPVAALIVGLCSGLGRGLGQTHAWFDLFHFAFAAVLASALLQQDYRGRFYHWLRHPVISSTLASTSVVFLSILVTFASADVGAGYVIVLDRALFVAEAYFWSLLIEGVLAGVIVALVLMGLPHLRPAKSLTLSPLQLSLRKRLLSNFVFFAILLTALMIVIVFSLSINISTRLVINQMAHNSKTVSAEIPDFQEHLEKLLASFDEDEKLLENDSQESEKILGQLFRTDRFYRRILLVNGDGKVTAFFPSDADGVEMSALEKEAVSKTLSTNSANVATAESLEEEHVVSFVAPVRNTEGTAAAVLVGRVAELPLENLIVGLQGTVGQGIGFIVDQQSKIIAHTDESLLLEEWDLAKRDVEPIRTNQTEPGTAYRSLLEEEDARELVYYSQAGDGSSWNVVTTVPYAVVLNMAIGIGGPLTLMMILVMVLFYVNLAMIGHDISRPVAELVEAAKTIAAGGRWSPSPDSERHDEIGQLNQAFDQMHRTRNRRLGELSLLLDVSHNVAANIDITQGMPAILRGALRGTGAAGARAVVPNPSGSYPLTFGEGPASDAMAALDRSIMTRLRHSQELILATPAQVREALDIGKAELPIPALIAIPLHSHGRFQGIMWLGYRQSHNFDPTAHTLLQTLAGQAAILVENARLFAIAEGGRRRLAAVLASTTDAVIVTDQTERVLLINRAMENAFNLTASQVVGRPLADVIQIAPLIDALTAKDKRVRNLEIPNIDGRVFYTNAAPIISNDGQALGRVAVLHDITHLKEIDEMKSDFVTTVSHDLRNPLTFMRGYITMLPMVGETNEKQEEYIDKSLKGIEQMTDLVSDLLDLGRIEAGVEMNFREIDLDTLLSDLKAEYFQFAHQNGIRLQVEVPRDTPQVKGDESLIRQAVTNLISNGIKYARDSGPMMLRAEAINKEVIISLQDNGPGIPKQDQMRLFEKFYRVKGVDSEKVKGSGLGLAIVKSIAERHGGRVWCDSQEGRGSTFSILLPVEPSRNEEHKA